MQHFALCVGVCDRLLAHIKLVVRMYISPLETHSTSANGTNIRYAAAEGTATSEVCSTVSVWLVGWASETWGFRTAVREQNC
jgi:hypothetical protein